MEETTTAVNTTESAATPKDVITDVDYEAKYAALETERTKLTEEKDNWKTAALKYKAKAKEGNLADDDEDDRIKRIAKEAVAESRLAEIAREQDALLTKSLKENKELKLALQNKTTTPPATTGTHSEASVSVKDTILSPDQLADLKARGWDDKTIERFKGNLRKNSR